MQNREELLTRIPTGGVCVEIGVFKGDFSAKILSIARPKTLYLVDPFEGRVISGDENGDNRQFANLPEEYQRLKELYENDKRVSIQPVTSQLFFELVCPEVDFVYVDGDHTYNAVRQDLQNAWEHLKVGGYLAGHDYHSSHEFIAVKKAVDEFCGERGVTLEVTGGKLPSYLIKKVG